METSRQSCQQCERWCEHFSERGDLSFASSFRLFCLFIYFFSIQCLLQRLSFPGGAGAGMSIHLAAEGLVLQVGCKAPGANLLLVCWGLEQGACVLSLCLLRAFSVWAPCHISFLSKVVLKKPSSKERLFVLTWLLPFRTEQANGGIYFSHLELNAALSRTSRCREVVLEWWGHVHAAVGLLADQIHNRNAQFKRGCSDVVLW